MKIPNTMPHLQNKHVLILVSGGNSAYIYEISHSNCDLVDRISPLMLKLYRDFDNQATLDTDYKGHAKTLNRPSRSLTQDRLIKMISEKLSQHIAANPEELYIFCPQKISSKLIQSIDKQGGVKIQIARYGNYTKFHPNDLLKRIEQIAVSRLVV